MKKQIWVGLCAAALCFSSVTTVFADEFFDGGPGYSGVQEGYRDSDGKASAENNPETGASDYTDPYTNYNPWGYSYEQPPRQENMADYTLPFSVVMTTGYDSLWTSWESDAAIVTTAEAGEMFRLIEETGDYYKVLYDGRELYMGKNNAAVTSTLRMDANMEKRAEVVMNAFQNLGVKYTYGGSSASTGFDCSGFVQSTMSASGISVPRTTKEQVKAGTAIELSQIRPGDLLLYGNDEASVNHAAMYIGNGMLIHSHSTGFGVRVQNYNYKGAAPFRIVNVIGDQN